MRKVPEITVFFWIIKLMTTALGEATSDYLIKTFDPYVVLVCGFIGFLAIVGMQLRSRRYVPWIYWLTIVMVAIFGTMAADVIHVVLGIPYAVSTACFLLCSPLYFGIGAKSRGRCLSIALQRRGENCSIGRLS